MPQRRRERPPTLDEVRRIVGRLIALHHALSRPRYRSIPEEIADRMGVSRATVHNWIGRRYDPEPWRVAALGRAIDDIEAKEEESCRRK